MSFHMPYDAAQLAALAAGRPMPPSRVRAKSREYHITLFDPDDEKPCLVDLSRLPAGRYTVMPQSRLMNLSEPKGAEPAAP